MLNLGKCYSSYYPEDGQRQKVEIENEAPDHFVYSDKEEECSQDEHDIKKEMHIASVHREVILQQAADHSSKTEPENKCARAPDIHADEGIQEIPKNSHDGTCHQSHAASTVGPATIGENMRRKRSTRGMMPFKLHGRFFVADLLHLTKAFARGFLEMKYS